MLTECGRARLATWSAAACLLAFLAAACSTAPATPSAQSSHRSTRQTPPPAPVPAGFCRATARHGLRETLRRTVPASRQAEVLPLGVSPRGEAAYVATWTPAFSGVAELSLRTGSLRRIQRFANPVTDQADGTANGRWLVWAETYSLNTLDNFSIFAWNADTGRLRKLGHSIASRSGVPWPSPWHAPAVSRDYAAWAQGYGPGGLVEIRLANLRTLRAYNVQTHSMATLPPALAAVHGTEFVVTDGRRTAYLSPSLSMLYYSPAQDRPARLVVRLTAGNAFADLAIGPGSLAWTTSKATYLASTSTGTFSRVTPQYGFPTGSASLMLITDAPATKSAHPVLPLHVIRPSALAWAACGSHAA
jgi:hypothetical protein